MTTLNELGMIADPDFVRDELEAASLNVVPFTGRLHLAPLDCGICRRRSSESTIVIGGRITPICSTCWERAEDERQERPE